MPARKYLLSFSLLGLLSIFAGCGGSASRPTPRGGFTASSVSGSYAFVFSGNDVNGLFGIAGSLQADGAGHITSGVMDINQNNSSGTPQPITNQPFTGTYTVQADGRGVATLSSTAGTFHLAFVIINAQRALMTRFEQVASGSGAMDLQTSSAFSNAALAGSFAFNLSGVDGVGAPFASAGSVTTDSTGAVTSGVVDSADNGSISQNVPVTSGALAVGSSNGRATLDITTAGGTVSFAAYIVDANHLKLVETDTTTGAQLSGEAFRQPATLSNASFSGPFAFTVAGVDSGQGLPFSAGGVLTADGAGTITSGTEDLSELNFNPLIGMAISNTSTYSISGVRGTLSLQTSNATFNFAIYPTISGVQVIETDAGVVGTGSAFGQTGPFTNNSISGAYGMNFTAVIGTEVDTTASLTADGTAGTLKGIIDINELNTPGFPAPGTSLSGNYSVNADGRGSFNLTTGLGTQTMAVYVVNNSRALFIEVDGGVVSVGAIEHQ